jgi:cyclophilin family peptidyl-prolyl cis-trans isomerase
MRPKYQIILQMALVLFAAGCVPSENDQAEQAESAAPSALDPTPTVILETNKGRIVLELDREKAPQTVANFVKHVRGGFYNGLTFHRVRPGFMIQGGRLTPDRQSRTSPEPPLQNEADNGLKNLRGTVAMARTRVPNSAVSEFFINHVDNVELDFTDRSLEGWGYAVFGKVIEGLDVVDAIAAVPTERSGQHEAIPLDPVVIERAYLQQSAGN